MTYALIIFSVLFLLILIGIPIAYSIELSVIVLLLVTRLKPMIIIPQKLEIGMDTFVYLAIPMFTFAGYLMEQGGLSDRLVDCVEKLFGWFPGSMGTITIICCLFFAALTGSGPATVAAIGAIMIPSMLNNGYTKQEASGLLAAGGALGPIVPPSIAMIVYATTMGLSVPGMFMAALVPGIILGILFIITNTILFLRKGIKTEREHFTLKELGRSIWRALGVIFLPVLVLGGIYGGIFTPTEAATIASVYALILGLVYRQLTLEKLIDAMKKTVTTSAMVIFIVGVSNIFGTVLAAANIPRTIAHSIIPLLHNRSVYMIILIILLMLVGCIMETVSSIVILAPILVPIGTAMGIDPMHLAIVFSVTLIVGFITPPFGLNLFTSAATANVSFSEVVKGVVPYLATAIIAVFLFAFIPQISLALPSLLGY
ncbi:MAG: TRAP transporter large permease [Eubacterium sp.]|nr:TRAP transporter large permease [Eubacterium sp.]